VKSKTISIEVLPPERYAFVDLTEELQRAVKDSGITDGAALIYCPHTTTALIINEWEDGAMQDFRDRIENLVPENMYYAHDDLERRTQNLDEVEERKNGHSHIQAMLLSATSQMVPVTAGEPMLGRWQRLMLVELDEPKGRGIVFHVFGE
jgi:secondary thiamine-phosphate synthase enzyme